LFQGLHPLSLPAQLDTLPEKHPGSVAFYKPQSKDWGFFVYIHIELKTKNYAAGTGHPSPWTVIRHPELVFMIVSGSIPVSLPAQLVPALRHPEPPPDPPSVTLNLFQGLHPLSLMGSRNSKLKIKGE
jgi:hypothetical protein